MRLFRSLPRGPGFGRKRFTDGEHAPICQIPRKEAEMTSDAFQDFYPDDLSQCYGCGRLNEHGLQIKSRWEGDESVCTYTPQPYHTAIPG